jgi:hypothetical protein
MAKQAFGADATFVGNLTLKVDIHAKVINASAYLASAALHSNVSVDQTPLPVTGQLVFADKGMSWPQFGDDSFSS